MRLLFQKGATLKQKILGSLVLAVAVFIPFAIFSKVLINENVISTLSIATVIASVLTIIFLSRALLDKTSTMRKHIKERGERTISFVFIFFFITPLILYPSISVGIPSALHMLVSEPGELVVTIKHKQSSYRSRHCNGGIYIEEYTYFMNNQVCGISKNDWDSLVPADKIRLSGKKSYFGFSYDQYEKLTKRCTGSACTHASP